MKIRSLVSATLGVGLFLITASATAAEGSWTPRMLGSRVGVDIGWWGREYYDNFNFAVVGQFEIIRVLHLDFEVPWTFLHTNPDVGAPDTVTAFGNPTFGAHYGAMFGNRVGFYAGGTLSVPTATRLDANTRLTGLFATEANAYGDMHRYLSEYVHLRGRVGVEIRLARVLYYQGEVAPLFMLDVGRDVARNEFVFETSHAFEARAPVGAGGGVRFQAVFFTFDPNDSAQAALEPYFAFEPPDGHFYARVGFLLALDDDLGFGFDRGKVATIRTTLGGKW